MLADQSRETMFHAVSQHKQCFSAHRPRATKSSAFLMRRCDYNHCISRFLVCSYIRCHAEHSPRENSAADTGSIMEPDPMEVCATTTNTKIYLIIKQGVLLVSK